MLLIWACMIGVDAMYMVKDEITPLMEGLIGEMAGLPMTTMMSNVMLRDTKQHFVDRMGPDGPWPPLAEITIKNRREMSDTPLRDSGQLYQSEHITPTDTQAAVSWNKYDHYNKQSVPQLQFEGGQTKIRQLDGTDILITVPPRPANWLSDIAIREIEALPEYTVRGLHT